MQRIYRIRLSHHIGVTPDWFDTVHPAWEDAAAIMRRLDQMHAKPPDVTTWKRGEKPPTLDSSSTHHRLIP